MTLWAVKVKLFVDCRCASDRQSLHKWRIAKTEKSQSGVLLGWLFACLFFRFNQILDYFAG